MSLAYRLLAVDVDGTLLNSSSQLPERNREALHRAHQAGLVICICTGRSLTEARGVIADLGLDLDAGVFVFGAIVADLQDGTPLYRTGMSAGLADRLVGHLRERGHPVLVLYDSSEAGFDYLLVEGQQNRQAYERWLSFTPCAARTAASWQPLGCTPLRVGIIEKPDRIEQTMAGLRSSFDPAEAKINSIYAPNYGLHVVECFAPKVNKWYGISQLARRLGIQARQIAAVGDDINDLEMISRAGLGVAMGNAIEPVRKLANFQVATNNDAGVAILAEALLQAENTLPCRSDACLAD